MDASTTDWIQAASSVLTLGAAIAAAIIAAKAPRLAARFAEDFRSQSAAEEEKRRFRMNVFMALMKCRREFLNVDARSAVNLVDVAFSDDIAVLNARRLFLDATMQPNANLIVERYHALTEVVARAMGFDTQLTPQDIRGGWYPDALNTIDQAAIAEAEEKLARRRTN